MKVKQITLGSSTLALAVLLTACGGSSSSGVQKPTPLVANTNNSGNHGATNHGNHGATNPSTTVSYAFLKDNAIEEAEDYVREKDGVVPKITGYTLSVDGKAQDGGIDLSKYPKGYSTLNIKETVTGEVKGKSGSITTDSVAYLFQQEYSSVIGFHNKNVTTVLNGHQETKPVNEIDFLGRGTPTEKLPTTGKFNYLGSGKVGLQSGAQEVNFNYNVDFGAKTGSGRLGNITLSEGKIKAVKHDDNIGDGLTTQFIEGRATDGSLNGEYGLGFYGPNADEIVGAVGLGDKNDVIGVFGGTKQAK
jgi:lipoprotein GNA1870 C like protein